MPVAYVKRATTPEQVHALRTYASLLHDVAHPGVIAIAGQRFGATSGELHLRPVVGATLAAMSSTDEMRVALLNTVAHLHRHGVAHRAIQPEHVLVQASDGRPVLCGFGKATRNATPAEFAADISAVEGLFPHSTGDDEIDLRQRLLQGDVSTAKAKRLPLSWIAAAIVVLFIVVGISAKKSAPSDAAVQAVTRIATSQPAGTIDVAGETFTIGGPDDAVLLPPAEARAGALLFLDAPSGDIYAFAKLPTGGGDASGVHLGQVSQAVALAVDQKGDGSHIIVAVDAAGVAREVSGRS